MLCNVLIKPMLYIKTYKLSKGFQMTRFIIFSILSLSLFAVNEHQLIEIGSDYYSSGEKIMLDKVKEPKEFIKYIECR